MMARQGMAIPFVHELRVQRSPAQNAESYTVLPGPFPVMGFRIAGELRAVRSRGPELLQPAGMTAIQEAPQSYQSLPHTWTVLVALKPEGAFGLFGIPMAELVNREVALEHLISPHAARMTEERVAAATTADEAALAVTSMLAGVARASRARIHPAVAAAASAILASHGSPRIEQVAQASTRSRRQLERLFRTQVGVSPKRLASLARFAWAAKRVARAESLGRLAFAAGYADQAHFIREFKAFAHLTPGELRGAPIDL
jgi:AraC-like DNA-binding protein